MDIRVTQKTEWGDRAAWEARRLIDEKLEDVVIRHWGVDARDKVLWLNIDSGDVNFDIAITREFHEYGFFRQTMKAQDGYYRSNRPAFLSYIRRGKPGAFSQNGVGRYLYDIDMEDPEEAHVLYEDDGPIPDFTEQEKREAEELAKAEEEWSAAEKERVKAAREVAKKAKAAK